LSTFLAAQLEAVQNRLESDISSGRIPGAAIVVGRRDQILFERHLGFSNTATGHRVAPDTVWRIFSMTKPIVTVAAMALVERGLLRLDQHVAEFIPSFGNLRLACGDQGTTPAQSQPTIQDLMRHTAGLAYGFLGDSPAQRAYAADGLLTADLPLADFVDRIAALPLEYQPGTTWHYSHATDVLGRVLEVISGKDLYGVILDTLLGPLGMTDTAFALQDDRRDRVAQPLPQPPDANVRFFDPCRPRRRQSAGGGLVSTTIDYTRFLRMLLNGGSLDGRRVLSAPTLRQMIVNQLGPDIRRAPYYPPGAGYGFGLGFAVRTAEGEAPFPGSRGDYFWSGVGGTYFWVDPVHDFFALFMLQSSSPQQRLHYRSLMRNMIYAAIGH
jgi:CubicO group peptidase (beta-lactamase class C family)